MYVVVGVVLVVDGGRNVLNVGAAAAGGKPTVFAASGLKVENVVCGAEYAVMYDEVVTVLVTGSLRNPGSFV